MTKTTACLAAVAALAALAVSAGEEKPPIPEGARVTISFDKNECFLGENVLVHFTVENVGKTEFKVDTGGDYRASPRHLRYTVTAAAEDGTAAADPHPNPFCMGGLSCAPPVKPGGKFEQSLALMRYCRIDQPGAYTVRVSHDLGWKPDKDGKSPEAAAKVTFVMPTPEQARKVVEAMYAMPENTGATWGQRSKEYPDFGTLRYPVYLSILAERAAKGCEKALYGISRIPTPEATARLLELAAGSAPELLVKVVQNLSLRLPDPYLEKKLPSRGFWEDTREGERRWMVKQAWRPEFAARARKLIPPLLAHDTLDSVACGAFLCECIGDKDDAPHLLKALDSAITKTKTAPLETSCYPRPRGNCAELLRAAEMLLARGADVPTVPTSPGEAVFLAMASSLREGFRPPGLKAQWVALLDHEIPYVREKALDYAPPALTKLLAPLAVPLLADADVDVQIAACHFVERTKSEALREPLLKALAAAKEEWLFNAAVSAAHALGARLDACEVLAARLDDPEMVPRCLQRLAGLFSDTSPRSSSRKLDAAAAKALKERWLKFFAENGKALREGRKFRVGDAEVTADLFAGCVSFTLPDGKRWPSSAEKP